MTVKLLKNYCNKNISIDSRTIKNGEMFVAIKGERFDGHDFVEEAFRKGAVGAIVQTLRHKRIRQRRKNLKLSAKSGSASAGGRSACGGKGGKTQNQNLKFKTVIRVKDTLKALGDLAHQRRTKFNIPIIAVTGSTGKTIVKEIISYILDRKSRVLKNEGTKNNLIGLPLTLLKMNRNHHVCVLEIGASHLGEIKRLSEIAKPTMGVITNIGPTHLKYLKNLQNVFKVKSELLDTLSHQSLVLLNKDDRFLANAKAKCKKIYFGVDTKCQFQATNIEKKDNGMMFKVGGTSFSIALFGIHNVYNALAGIAVAHIFGMKLRKIEEILKDFSNPFEDRLALCKNRYLTILNDTYNSNPLSFERALEVLMGLDPEKRKVVISADMLELGEGSRYLHAKIGKRIAQSGAGSLITVGEMSRYMSEGAIKHGMKREGVMFFNRREDLLNSLINILREGDIVLVKGSRAMHMEEVVNAIKEISNAVSLTISPT